MTNSNQFCFLSHTLSVDELAFDFYYDLDSVLQTIKFDHAQKQEFVTWIKSIAMSGSMVVWDLKKLAKDCLSFFSDEILAYEIYSLGWMDVKLAAYLDNSLIEADFGSLVKTILQEAVINFDTHQNELEADSDSDSTLSYLKQVKKLFEYYYTKFEHYQPKVLKIWQTMESPLAVLLAKMEFDGIFVDKVELNRLKDLMLEEMNALEQQITDFLGPLNINSPSQLGKALADKGYFLKPNKKTGNYSTNKQVLEELLTQDDSGIVLKILKYRTVSKLYGTYINAFLTLPDSSGRIHCQFNQVAASTGRLSSNNPNLQNIPIKNEEYGARIRACFQAGPGKVLLTCDYSQIELRLLAHFSGDERLLESFANNEDIHARTAAEVFGVAINQITSSQRRLGKTLNFALIYQQGSFATARMLGLELKEAEEFIRKYFASFPKIKPFIEQTLLQAKEQGFVESLYGRRRWFPNIKSPVFALRQAEERAAFNMALQGSNADLIKVAMLEIFRQIKDKNLPAKILLQIHDELVLEVDEQRAAEVKNLVTDIMSKPAIELKVPIVVEGGYSLKWSK